MHSRPIPGLAPLVALLCACNTAAVLPPDGERFIGLVETDLWSGGEVRAVVRHADAEEAPLTITLDGEVLTVTRVDDTTFAAPLPVHTGELSLRVEREDLDPLETTIALHGFESVVSGPLVAGAVVARPGPVTHVLGAVVDGAVEVSLETGMVTTSWPQDVHALQCTNGIAPGPEAATVLLRGRAGNGECLPNTVRSYTAQGLSAVSLAMTWNGGSKGLSAMVGPSTVIRAFHDNFALVHECEPAPPWTVCDTDQTFPTVHHHILGWVAGHAAQRIVSVSRRAGLHDLETGAVLAVLPAGAELAAQVQAVAFSGTQDTLFVAGQPNCCDNAGFVQLRDAVTGSLLTSIPVDDGVPIAVAVDMEGDRLVTVIHDLDADAVWLRVFSRSHQVVIDLPISEGTFPENVWRYRHHSLLFDSVQREAILVSAAYHFPGSGGAVVQPMLIHRWSLTPE